jgi:hypothetical protein
VHICVRLSQHLWMRVGFSGLYNVLHCIVVLGRSNCVCVWFLLLYRALPDLLQGTSNMCACGFLQLSSAGVSGRSNSVRVWVSTAVQCRVSGSSNSVCVWVSTAVQCRVSGSSNSVRAWVTTAVQCRVFRQQQQCVRVGFYSCVVQACSRVSQRLCENQPTV